MPGSLYRSVNPPESSANVIGFFHCGVSVASLDRSLDFYCGELGLEIQAQRDATDEYLRQMHGLPFTVVRMAFLRIPNSTTLLELLEYQGVDVARPTYIPMDPATGHVCFLVDDLEAMYAQLTARGYAARSPGPIDIVAGPNSGSRAIYFEDPDGYPVEFIERPAT